jgi:hypothetical protein
MRARCLLRYTVPLIMLECVAKWVRTSCLYGNRFLLLRGPKACDLQARDKVWKSSGSSRVLIATDLLERGVVGQQVSLVINCYHYTDREPYLRRIGRSGRFRHKKAAINFMRAEQCGRFAVDLKFEINGVDIHKP